MTHDPRRLIYPRSGRALVVVAALIACALSFAVTASNVFTTKSSTTALMFWPWSSGALAAKAASASVSNVKLTSAQAAEISTDAYAALDRSVVNALAARTFAMGEVIQGNAAAGANGFRYAEYLTRRDVPTELYLIESAVGRGDIADALVHYDRALRVSDKARSILFPIMVSAADEPAIRSALARRLASRPPWWAPFLSQVIGLSTKPESMVPLVLAARLDPADPSGRQLSEAALDRLIGWGRYDVAWRMQWHWVPGVEKTRDGSLLASERMGPFAWRLVNRADVAAAFDRRGDTRILSLLSSTEAGEVARQLVRMVPGPTQLSVRSGDFSDGAFATISLRCAPNNQLIASQRIASAGDDGAIVGTRFVVPPSCRFAWLTIDYQPADGGGGAWLSDLSLGQV